MRQCVIDRIPTLPARVPTFAHINGDVHCLVNFLTSSCQFQIWSTFCLSVFNSSLWQAASSKQPRRQRTLLHVCISIWWLRPKPVVGKDCPHFQETTYSIWINSQKNMRFFIFEIGQHIVPDIKSIWLNKFATLRLINLLYRFWN